MIFTTHIPPQKNSHTPPQKKKKTCLVGLPNGRLRAWHFGSDDCQGYSRTSLASKTGRTRARVLSVNQLPQATKNFEMSRLVCFVSICFSINVTSDNNSLHITCTGTRVDNLTSYDCNTKFVQCNMYIYTRTHVDTRLAVLHTGSLKAGPQKQMDKETPLATTSRKV